MNKATKWLMSVTLFVLMANVNVSAQQSFCNETTYHLGIMAETASTILLTIENMDASSMKVTIESADADPVDVLIVNNSTGPITGSPAVSAVDTVGATLSTTLTWTDTPPTDVELNILWSKESFGGNWQAIASPNNLSVPFNNSCATAVIPSLFFSEYIEGSSNNKALEIYNPTVDSVSLDNYQIAQSSNGGGWAFFHTFPAGSKIAPGDVYVIITDETDGALFDAANADEVLGFPSTVHHNGNDARAIIHIADTDTTILDVFGDPDSDVNWDVAGVSEGAKEHTLIRKPEVMMGNPTPLASFGTNAEDSEWIVNDQNDFSNLGIYGMAAPEAVTVTFNVNTSTVVDTLFETGVVQVRGGTQGPDVAATGLGSTITWDSGTIHTTNVGGDYWTVSFDMSPGDTLNYKFWIGSDSATPLINGSEQGWESGGNNQFILPAEAVGDTTVPMQWYETRMAPFDTSDDSVSVFFKVNVGAQLQTNDFDPENDLVGVRGGGALFTNDWGTGDFLEYQGENGPNTYYSGVVTVQKDSAATIGGIGYKFVFEKANGDVAWESGDNRGFTVPTQDTTIYWDYFNRTAPTNDKIVNTNLNFSVSVGILEGLGFFNSSIDTVHVTGTFNSWNNTANRMTFNNVSGNYDGLNIPLTAAVGSDVLYKYYIKWDASRDDSSSVNYLSGITHDGSGWEEPGVTGGADRVLNIADAENQETQIHNYNGVPFQGLMTANNVEGGAISVTFNYDMAPAADDSVSTPFNPATDSVFLFVDTPFFALTNGITVPGDGGENFLKISDEERERLRFTDEDGDMVYSLTLDLNLPTLNHIGFRVAYGEPTSPNGQLIANGDGFAAGRRHYQYVQPIVNEQLAVSWPATYTMPTITWQEENLEWETPPDYTVVTTSNENDGDNAEQFSLLQNYPNPFNPTTNISFVLPNAANVSLKVYNVLGQEVATLIDGRSMTSGTHSIGFDASSLSSGMYIYRIEAGNFSSSKRMMLIK